MSHQPQLMHPRSLIASPLGQRSKNSKREIDERAASAWFIKACRIASTDVDVCFPLPCVIQQEEKRSKLEYERLTEASACIEKAQSLLFELRSETSTGSSSWQGVERTKNVFEILHKESSERRGHYEMTMRGMNHVHSFLKLASNLLRLMK